jgi:TonB family protein
MIKVAVWSAVITALPLVATPCQTPASARCAAIDSVAARRACNDSLAATAAIGKPTSDKPMFTYQVDRRAQLIPGSPVPNYPIQLRAANIQGSVFAKFVVDTAGRVELQTFEILKSDDSLFTNAVRAVLPQLRFFPAMAGSRKVRSLVQMPFAFSLRKP